MARGSGLAVGQFVRHPKIDGVAKIGEICNSQLGLNLFESAAEPVIEQVWVAAGEARRCILGAETRVYWPDDISGCWRAGRVVGGGPDLYFVRVPNSDTDIRKSEADLCVRWERPVKDPLQVLLAGAQESPMYRDARLPVLHTFVRQRAACASATAIISSTVQIHPHQVNAALRVLSDPVQRYLLADEVGLGKTIEAGFVIRQRFLDDPHSKVVVVAPDVLRRQWRNELRDRFFVDDFSGNLTITSHEEPANWSRYHDYDLAVVDEAHLLAGTGDPTAHPYPQLKWLCHSAQRLLLLSATPVLQREATHLGLLHLLDPALYRWEDLEGFRSRLAVRRELARAVYAMDPSFPFLLPSTIDQVRALLPLDARFEYLSRQIRAMLDETGDLADHADQTALIAAVGALRGHVGETYRLHRRVIRNRRAAVLGATLDDEGLLAPFEVTGRRRPTVVELDSLEHAMARQVLERWQIEVRDSLLDCGADAARHGPALAVLASRVGGPARDLCAALRWRLAGDANEAELADLSAAEREILTAPPKVPEEYAILRDLEQDNVDDGLAEIIGKLGPASRASRVVVFAGPGVLASSLARAMTGVHEHTRAAGAEASEAAATAWWTSGGILICDGSAEDGRNFQQADLVVHLRLPSNPNAVEQRVGRVDRYGSTRPARQVMFGDLDDTSITAAWRQLLVAGYAVFERSISALQDPIDRDLSAVWSAAVTDGVAGLLAQRTAIAESLRQELLAVAQLDALEAADTASVVVRDVTMNLARLEVEPQALGRPLSRLLTGDDGFRFFERRNLDGSVTYENGPQPPLLSPRLLARLRGVPPASRKACVDRWQALKTGNRMLRLGNPFIDAVVTILGLDDRGQASAHWRMDPTWYRDPLPYFGFDFLVEADLLRALTVVGNRPGAEAALRRRADRSFEPFLRRIWIPADGTEVVREERTIQWLDATYQRASDDVNLNAVRIGVLHELFGGAVVFAEAATATEEVARSELGRVTDLPVRCRVAAETLRADGAVLAAQARARQAAGRLVTDDDSLLLDRALNEALAEGVDQPQVRLVAVTCLVRSRVRWARYAAN